MKMAMDLHIPIDLAKYTPYVHGYPELKKAMKSHA